MTLTKDDLQAIGTVVDEKLQASEKRLLSEVDKRFIAQGKSIAQGFADLKAVMEQTYVNREEFEERYNELQNEVDDLRERMKKLESRLTP